jgi:hypothetical protein
MPKSWRQERRGVHLTTLTAAAALAGLGLLLGNQRVAALGGFVLVRRRRRSTLELILLFVRNRAAAGDVRAFQAASDLLTRFGPQEPEEGRGCLLIPEATPEEFEQLLKDLREQHRRREEEDQRFK